MSDTKDLIKFLDIIAYRILGTHSATGNNKEYHERLTMLGEIEAKLLRLDQLEPQKEACDHGLLKWSPINKVVQCYNCGKPWGE